MDLQFYYTLVLGVVIFPPFVHILAKQENLFEKKYGWYSYTGEQNIIEAK